MSFLFSLTTWDELRNAKYKKFLKYTELQQKQFKNQNLNF